MKPYPNSESKKEQVRTMFDGIAHRYDLLNHLLSLGIDQSWRRRMVRMIRRHHPERVLDMATGTADLAIMIAQGCPQTHVTGIDLSDQMLEVGRRKVTERGLGERIELSQGDAETTSYGREHFDIATVAFGVRNFEDIEAGISGLFRSLKPGGRLYVLEFGMPKNPSLRACYRFYFHKILPRLGGAISNDSVAYTYLPESVDEFPYGTDFVAILHQTGFRDGAIKQLFGGVAQIYTAQKPK